MFFINGNKRVYWNSYNYGILERGIGRGYFIQGRINLIAPNWYASVGVFFTEHRPSWRDTHTHLGPDVQKLLRWALHNWPDGLASARPQLRKVSVKHNNNPNILQTVLHISVIKVFFMLSTLTHCYEQTGL